MHATLVFALSDPQAVGSRPRSPVMQSPCCLHLGVNGREACSHLKRQAVHEFRTNLGANHHSRDIHCTVDHVTAQFLVTVGLKPAIFEIGHHTVWTLLRAWIEVQAFCGIEVVLAFNARTIFPVVFVGEMVVAGRHAHQLLHLLDA